MMPLVVVRPHPGCDATMAAARTLGLDAHGFPLFEVRAQQWEAPSPTAFDALLLGSANALRHAGPALESYHGLPAYAVGAETARAAEAAGLHVAARGTGGLQAMLAAIDPAHRRLLRVSGETRIALDAPPGITITERVVYSSEPLPMPAELVRLLAQPALVLLHSAEAARHFASECGRHNLDRTAIALATLGPRISVAAGEGWRALEAAATPDDGALLALAANLCQTVPGLRGMA